MSQHKFIDRKEELEMLGYDYSRNDSTLDIIFSECKWSNKPIDIDVYSNLKRKSGLVSWNNDKRTEYFILFSKLGLLPDKTC